jgi:hypothetical protein
MMAIRRRGARRGSRGPASTIDAANNRCRAGEGLQPIHPQAVLSGSGDEVIDLAKVNLMR